MDCRAGREVKSKPEAERSRGMVEKTGTAGAEAEMVNLEM